MAWTHFPLDASSIITDEAVWQELVEGINERARWAGVSEIAVPVAGDEFFTAAKAKEMQDKVEEIIPFFTDPDPTIDKDSVVFTNWTFSTFMQWMEINVPDARIYFWTGLPRWHRWVDNSSIFGSAVVGDNAIYPNPNLIDHYVVQIYRMLNELKYTTKTVSWGSEQDRGLRWMSSLGSYPDPRLFTPPANPATELFDGPAQTYVEDHWASGDWWAPDPPEIPPQSNTVNGPYYVIINPAPWYSMQNGGWGETRYVANASGAVFASGDALIEIGRKRTNLNSITVVSGDASKIFAYEVPYTRVYDNDGGVTPPFGPYNEIIATGDAVQVQVEENHTSGTLLASGLSYDDSRPTPTPQLSDVSGGYSERYEETYHELNAEVLIELDFDKMT